MRSCICFFFFQAEDGIRDADVTGVQTCTLPIFRLDRLGMRGMVRECASRERKSVRQVRKRAPRDHTKPQRQRLDREAKIKQRAPRTAEERKGVCVEWNATNPPLPLILSFHSP